MEKYYNYRDMVDGTKLDVLACQKGWQAVLAPVHECFLDWSFPGRLA